MFHLTANSSCRRKMYCFAHLLFYLAKIAIKTFLQSQKTVCSQHPQLEKQANHSCRSQARQYEMRGVKGKEWTIGGGHHSEYKDKIVNIENTVFR